MIEPAGDETAAGPSRWVARFLPPAPPAGGGVLDLAAGRGRHIRLARSQGWRATGVDREAGALAGLAAEDEGVTALRMDLEAGDAADTARALKSAGPFDIVIVCNYLHRPLLPHLPALLKPEGHLIYETFMVGNEAWGRPRNPDFLLRPGELLTAFGHDLAVLAFEQGYTADPSPRVVQRFTGIAGDPVLPDSA
ncbi:MAG: methyltransferase domain-containing protein [Rhodospirillaceae bacterium]|nr:methyltransferase domain-containing protein [Rhodospirillaceae bacterium]